MKRVPFSVIQAAKGLTLKLSSLYSSTLEGFIASQCLCYYNDKYGNTCSYVDDDFHYQAEIAAIQRHRQFSIQNEPPR